MSATIFRCSCGSSGRADSNPPGYAVELVAMLRKAHLAEGHHEVDAAEFKRIKARQRREEEKQLREAAR